MTPPSSASIDKGHADDAECDVGNTASGPPLQLRQEATDAEDGGEQSDESVGGEWRPFIEGGELSSDHESVLDLPC